MMPNSFPIREYVVFNLTDELLCFFGFFTGLDLWIYKYFIAVNRLVASNDSLFILCLIGLSKCQSVFLLIR